jgi:hypothetical protein
MTNDLLKNHKSFLGKRVLVALMSTSSRRAKNRVVEKGPWFTVEQTGGMKVEGTPANFQGTSWLLRSDCGWLGWLRPGEDFEVAGCNPPLDL